MLNNKNIIIFDFDGTLVDTMHVFADVASHLISENYGISKDEARQRYLETSGLPFCKQIEIMFPGHALNSKAVSLYEMEKLEATSDVKIDADTRGALRTLKEWGYDLVVSSNNFQHNVDNFVINSKLKRIFSLALGFKDGFGKGDQHFNYIKNNLGVEACEMVFVGDALNDARIAKENDLDFIAKLGTFEKKDFLKLDKNIKCIRNISDLTSAGYGK